MHGIRMSLGMVALVVLCLWLGAAQASAADAANTGKAASRRYEAMRMRVIRA
jgi:hypothetical protein